MKMWQRWGIGYGVALVVLGGLFGVACLLAAYPEIVEPILAGVVGLILLWVIALIVADELG